MDAVPPTIAGPAVARFAKVFRFAISEPRSARDRQRRREAVADYLDAWAGATIVAEQREGGRCWVWLRLERPARIEAVRAFLKECPHYVRDTFSASAVDTQPVDGNL